MMDLLGLYLQASFTIWDTGFILLEFQNLETKSITPLSVHELVWAPQMV